MAGKGFQWGNSEGSGCVVHGYSFPDNWSNAYPQKRGLIHSVMALYQCNWSTFFDFWDVFVVFNHSNFGVSNIF